MNKIKHDLIEWIPLKEVPKLVEKEIGVKPSLMTVYRWVHRGWLRTNGIRHRWKTTKGWLLQCLKKVTAPR